MKSSNTHFKTDTRSSRVRFKCKLGGHATGMLVLQEKILQQIFSTKINHEIEEISFMKKVTSLIILLFISVMLFASCRSENPVAGKKMALEANGMDIVYVFTDEQFWLEGLDGLKLNYKYDKEQNRIIYTDIDGSEQTIEMNILKEVK